MEFCSHKFFTNSIQSIFSFLYSTDSVNLFQNKKTNAILERNSITTMQDCPRCHYNNIRSRAIRPDATCARCGASLQKVKVILPFLIFICSYKTNILLIGFPQFLHQPPLSTILSQQHLEPSQHGTPRTQRQNGAHYWTERLHRQHARSSPSQKRLFPPRHITKSIQRGRPSQGTILTLQRPNYHLRSVRYDRRRSIWRSSSRYVLNLPSVTCSHPKQKSMEYSTPHHPSIFPSAPTNKPSHPLVEAQKPSWTLHWKQVLNSRPWSSRLLSWPL